MKKNKYVVKKKGNFYIIKKGIFFNLIWKKTKGRYWNERNANEACRNLNEGKKSEKII